ncbi:MAG: glycosyltransferase [Candidatus Omnitrophota bacterium]
MAAVKVVFVTREGYNLPGARIRCYNFSRELNRNGIASEVLSFSDTLGAKDGERESQLTLREKIAFNQQALARLLKNKGAVICIQRFNYHSFAPYLAHLVNRNKIILDLDDWEMREDPVYHFGFYPSSKAHYFTRQIARRSIFCIAASRFLEKFLLEFNKKVYYIPSGVDMELFRPGPEIPEREKIVFSWIGTFHRSEYVENIRFAVDCFMRLRKRYDHIFLEILGAGIHGNQVQKIIAEAGDSNILLKGWIAPQDVPGYLTKIGAGLLPVARDSKFNRAKSPTKLFEYMAMAKPSVCSSIGEAAEVIRDGENGLLAADKEEFTEKMRLLIEDRQLCLRIGSSARKTVESSYSLEALGIQLAELLK